MCRSFGTYRQDEDSVRMYSQAIWVHQQSKPLGLLVSQQICSYIVSIQIVFIRFELKRQKDNFKTIMKFRLLNTGIMHVAVMESQDTCLVSRLSRDVVFHVSVLALSRNLYVLSCLVSRVSMSRVTVS